MLLQVSLPLVHKGLPPGSYIIVPSTHEAGTQGNFCVWMVSNQNVRLQLTQGVSPPLIVGLFCADFVHCYMNLQRRAAVPAGQKDTF